MTAVAPLRPLGAGQRLAYLGGLRLLSRVIGRQILDDVVFERRRRGLHRWIGARSVLVGPKRGREVLCILTGEARSRGIPADTLVAVASGTGRSRGLACGLVTGGRGLRPTGRLQRIVERDVIHICVADGRA